MDKYLNLEEMKEVRQELSDVINSWGEPCVIQEGEELKETNTFFLHPDVIEDRELY